MATFLSAFISTYTAYLLSLTWAPQLSRDVTADTCVLYDKAAVIWSAIKKILYILMQIKNIQGVEVRVCGQDSPAWGPVTGSCFHGNPPSVFTRKKKFRGQSYGRMTINEEQRTRKEAMVAFFYDTIPWFGWWYIKDGEEIRSFKNGRARDLNQNPGLLNKNECPPKQSLSTFSIKRMKQTINISKTLWRFVVHTFHLRKFLMS